MFVQDALPFDCRYARLPSCDPVLDPSQSANITAAGLFYIRQRDTLDFGIDLTDWLQGNYNPEITGVTWSVAAGSPKAPVIGASTFDKDTKVSVIVTPAAAAVGGDAYWLEAEIDIGPVAAQAGIPPIPARKIFRRIHLVVVNG